MDATNLGLHHDDIPAIAWAKPWLYDPPNPDTTIHPYDEYLCRKEGINNDPDYNPDTDSNADTDSSDSNTTSTADSDSDDDSDPDDAVSLSQDSSEDEDTLPLDQQLDHAMHSLHDSANPGKPRRTITTPSGKSISKTTAVLMLRELFLSGNTLSKDRLKRIEQCASAAKEYTSQLMDHDGTQLELFQDVAIVFDAGSQNKLHVEFGRIQKLVTRTGKSKRSSLKLCAVPFDDMPSGLEVRCRFYIPTGTDRTYKYTGKPDSRYYKASSILRVVRFTYSADSDTYILNEDHYNEVRDDLNQLRSNQKQKKQRSISASKARKTRHLQEARSLEGDRSSRYRGDAHTMTRSRRERSSKRTGSTTLHTQRGRPLEVGLQVRLYHEVRVALVRVDCLSVHLRTCCIL